MKRTNELRAIASDEEVAALRAIAKQESRNAPEMLRELVRTEAKRRGLWPPREETAPS
jgi:hypothetical protein